MPAMVPSSDSFSLVSRVQGDGSLRRRQSSWLTARSKSPKSEQGHTTRHGLLGIVPKSRHSKQLKSLAKFEIRKIKWVLQQ